MSTCPRCQIALDAIVHHHAECKLCARCYGLFVKREDLEATLGPAAALLGKARRFSPLRVGSPQCPNACGPLAPRRVNSPRSRDIEIDACERCHGLWFDSGEIEALRVAHRRLPAPPPPAPDRAAAAWAVEKDEPRDRGEGLVAYLFQFFSGLPIEGHNRLYRRPLITWAIMIICVYVYWLEVTRGVDYVMANALVPATVTGLGELARQSLGSMFLHASPIHLIGNLYFLWVFGDNVEDRFGRLWFLPVYLACGFAATAAQYYADPTSMIPVVGASGAIGGMLGAYTLFFPAVRLRVAPTLFTFFHRFCVPAILYLPWWFAWQVIAILASSQQRVAYWAHAGGFVAGILFALLAKAIDYDARIEIAAAELARGKK